MLIPLAELIKKHRIKPTGVVHIGASTGQEAEDYFKAGIKHTFWVEALPHVYAQLQDHLTKIDFETTICSCNLLSDVDDEEVKFNIANNEGQSSSMFEFGTHSRMHPTVKFVAATMLKTKRFDTLINSIADEAWGYEKQYDFLNIDVQGAELKVLKGMGDLLWDFNFAYIEVNEDHLYKNCPLINEIDEYLAQFNFKRVETKITGWKWGDAFYIKQTI